MVAKIATQTGLWRAAGHEVRVFAVSPPSPDSAEPQLDADVFVSTSGTSRVRELRRLGRSVDAFAPDAAYVRYDVFPPSFARTLRRRPTALELNTDDLGEFRTRRSRAALVNRLLRGPTLRSAAGFVCVTNEIASSPSYTPFRKPTVVIANGIDLHRREPLPAPRGGNGRMVFLGAPRHPWHGVDKIVALAHEMPDVAFDIVGLTPAELPGGAPAPANMTLHGRLSPTEYEPILERADVGIGSLALHRNGMTEASPLKVREYLLYGLPVVVGYEDTDFIGDDPWFILRLPGTERNVADHVGDIRAFVENVRGRRVPHESIAERIGAPAKEAARLDFLDRLVQRSRRAG